MDVWSDSLEAMDGLGLPAYLTRTPALQVAASDTPRQWACSYRVALLITGVNPALCQPNAWRNATGFCTACLGCGARDLPGCLIAQGQRVRMAARRR